MMATVAMVTAALVASDICGSTAYTNVLISGSTISEVTSTCLPSLPPEAQTGSYGAPFVLHA